MTFDVAELHTVLQQQASQSVQSLQSEIEAYVTDYMSDVMDEAKKNETSIQNMHDKIVDNEKSIDYLSKRVEDLEHELTVANNKNAKLYKQITNAAIVTKETIVPNDTLASLSPDQQELAKDTKVFLLSTERAIESYTPEELRILVKQESTNNALLKADNAKIMQQFSFLQAQFQQIQAEREVISRQLDIQLYRNKLKPAVSQSPPKAKSLTFSPPKPIPLVPLREDILRANNDLEITYLVKQLQELKLVKPVLKQSIIELRQEVTEFAEMINHIHASTSNETSEAVLEKYEAYIHPTHNKRNFLNNKIDTCDKMLQSMIVQIKEMSEASTHIYKSASHHLFDSEQTTEGKTDEKNEEREASNSLLALASIYAESIQEEPRSSTKPSTLIQQKFNTSFNLLQEEEMNQFRALSLIKTGVPVQDWNKLKTPTKSPNKSPSQNNQKSPLQQLAEMKSRISSQKAHSTPLTKYLVK